MTPSVAYGKSQKWLDTHCAICDKAFTPKENRVRGTAVFNNDVEVKILCHEACAAGAEIQVAVKQTKELGMKR